MPFLLILTQIFISHEDSFPLLTLYPDESFILNNDIYTANEIIQIPTFSGSLNGNFHQIANIELDKSSPTVQLFGSFTGQIINLGLAFASFRPDKTNKFYGISTGVQGVLTNLSIQVHFRTSDVGTSFFALGGKVSAKILSLNAEISMSTGSVKGENICAFGDVMSGIITDSVFNSSFYASDPFESEFYAVCQYLDSSEARNITVDSNFQKILSRNYVFQNIKDQLEEFQINLKIDFEDFGSGKINNIHLLYNNSKQFTKLINVKINGIFKFNSNYGVKVGFVSTQNSFTVSSCFIQYELKQIGQGGLQFQFMEGQTSLTTIQNSTFNININQFNYGTFNLFCEILTDSVVRKSLFSIIYNQVKDNIGDVTISGLSFTTEQLELKYCNFYAKILPLSSPSSNLVFNMISSHDFHGNLNFVSTYLIVNEVPSTIGNKFYSGMFSIIEESTITNCLQFSELDLLKINQISTIGYSLQDCVVINFTLQAVFTIENLGPIYLLGKFVDQSVFTNLVIYANYTFANFVTSQLFSSLINEMQSTEINFCYLQINFISISPVSLDEKWTFLVGVDSGVGNKVSNLIETGVFIGQEFVPSTYNSGLNTISVVSAVFSSESNKTSYYLPNQRSYPLSEMKEKDFIRKQRILDPKVWKYKPGVNFDLPIHDYVFLTDKFWELDKYPQFDSLDTMLISGTTAKNHFVPQNGPNMCQMNCQGTQLFWDQTPICNPGFKGSHCNEIDCTSNPCKNGATCSSKKCNCKSGYTGLLCEINHCSSCPNSCYLVLGDIYRCDAQCEDGVNCIQGKCIDNICGCNNGITTAINSKISCDLDGSCIFKNRCGDKGVCVNETCVCDANSIFVYYQCYEKIHEDIGECFKDRIGYQCLSCKQERKLDQCTDCISGYKEYNGDCFPVCGTCNGDCVTIISGIHCFTCKNNYQVPECIVCKKGYREVSGVCYEVVNEAKGDCLIISGKVVCDKCFLNFAMPSCANCLDKYIENTGTCYPECPSSLCLGSNCYELSKDTYFCDSCKPDAQMPDCLTCRPGFKLVNQGCYEIILETHGDCWDQEGTVTCSSCKNEFKLPDCQTCSPGFMLKDSICYKICTECQGVNCYFKTATDRVCDSCTVGYTIPSCTTCTPDFKLQDNRCFQITNVGRGDCWQNRTFVNCSTCYNNHKLPSCDICKDGYSETGSQCLIPCGPDICFGVDCFYQLDSTLKCKSCNTNFVLPACDQCKSGFISIFGECFEQINEKRGICYINGIPLCDSCYDLFTGDLCDTCPSGTIEVDFKCQKSCPTCFGVNCYEDKSGLKTCEACSTSFLFPSCESCQPGYYLYDDYCNQIITGSNGNCINLPLEIRCFDCYPQYILSPDKSQCILACTSTNCLYGTCQPDQTCLCNTNFIGLNCDSCDPKFELISSICYLINSTSAGDCYINGVTPFCTSCNAGFELRLDKAYCYVKCTTANCINGRCDSGIGCVCDIGYKVDDDCKSYNCELDTVNPCKGLGKCEKNVCNCQLPSILLNDNCFDCRLVINGLCDLAGITCDIGWYGQFCQQFDCTTHTDSCLTDYFANSCTGPQCKCEYLNQLVGGQCIQFCPYPVIGVKVSLYESLNNNQGSVVQLQSGDRNRNLCVIGGLGCPFVNGKIKCNNGIRFAETAVKGVKIMQIDGCLPHYTGIGCNMCDIISISIDGFCFVKCQLCKGNCYFDQLDIVRCLTCESHFKLPDCQECEDGFALVDGECLKTCSSCHGQCYITAGGVIICNNCEDGYDITKACQSCVPGYEEVNNLCLQKCTVCTQGDCFIYQDDIFCTKCYNGAELTQCKNCLENFVFYLDKCQPLIPGTDCVIGHCFSCLDNEVLVKNVCYPKCSLPFCKNGLCYTNVIAQCLSCLPGYEMQANKSCLELEYIHGGVCTIDNPSKCTCYPGYDGERCTRCTFEQPIIDTTNCQISCDLDPTTICNGICHVTHKGYLVEIECESCQSGYILPDCLQCSHGYKHNSNKLCIDCTDGYVDQASLPSNVQAQLGPGCYKYCDLCEYGNCWLRGLEIVCISCSVGYDFAFNCQKCTEGYQYIGGRCLEISDTLEGECGSYSSKVCISCINNFHPQQCAECSPGGIVFDEKCTTPLHNIQDNCVMSSPSNFTCDVASSCTQGWLEGEKQKCSICNSNLVLINNTCWWPLTKTNMRYSGKCFHDPIEQVTVCETCEPEFHGERCDQCAHGFIQCENYNCCKEDASLSHTGVCFQSGGITICNTCATGYIMKGQLCIYNQADRRNRWWWLLLIILAILLIVLILYFMLTKKERIRIKRHKLKITIRQFLATFISIICGVIICQAIALCIAMQDSYVDDIYLYSASTSVGSLPFAIALFLLQPPSLDKFFYHKTSDFFMFLLGAGLDFLFQLIIYLLLPEALNVSQTIFKCFSAPFSMLLFTFILKMKYKPSQLTLLFIAVAMPLYYALSTAFTNVFENSYLLSEKSHFQLVIDLLLTIVAVILQASQILFLQNILGSYTEVQVMTRLGFAFFLIYSIFTLLNFKEVILSVYDQLQPMLIAMSLVFLINILMPLALIFMTPLAVTFNMLTSAVWVEIINALSIKTLQEENFYPTRLFPASFTSFMFIVVFISLICYYCLSNPIFEKFNIHINKNKQKQDFTTPYFTLKSQQKGEYYDMTKPIVTTKEMLYHKIKKQFSAKNIVSTKHKKIICIDKTTGKILQIPQRESQIQQLPPLPEQFSSYQLIHQKTILSKFPKLQSVSIDEDNESKIL